MAKRKKIGILLVYDETWAGGLYYIFNIIRSLNFLDDEHKPLLTVFFRNNAMVEKIIELGYPYLNFLPLEKPKSFFERMFAKLMRYFNPKFTYHRQYPRDIVDFIFPCDYSFLGKKNSFNLVEKVFWIADFQHKHLPQFFSKEEINHRDKCYEALSSLNVKLVLSSEDAKSDYIKFYPRHGTKINVLPFTSVLPKFEHLDITEVMTNFFLKDPFFISPNQFWSHKNHMVILHAVSILAKKDYDFQIVFTGNESDYRNVSYVDKLRNYIQANQIGKYIKFLGFIDRAAQLSLMKNARAVIQPSLFEGWSTVVEDTKAMGQTLILSNLSVHKEQCGVNACYFDPNDASALALQIESSLKNKVSFPKFDYKLSIKNYANKIIKL